MRGEQFIESRAILHRWIAFIVFFVSGFAALLYQVIWQRLLVFFSGADVYAVTLIVTTFMAGLGLGSFLEFRHRFFQTSSLAQQLAAMHMRSPCQEAEPLESGAVRDILRL